tara:strand:+ start:88 stop:1143 length:1056 start_codon:yes stop_codon:yes gene_type:complete
VAEQKGLEVKMNLATGLIIVGLITVLIYLVFRPQRGYFWQWRSLLRLSERVLSEDALKHLYDCEYEQRIATVQSLSGVLGRAVDQVAGLIEQIEACELVISVGASLQLTSKGREYALRIIRAHRLWEHYLSEETGLSESDWHKRAEQQEHRMSLSEADKLATRMGNPPYDPHGDPIPTEKGDLPPRQGQPLTTLAVGERATIAHLEDEPELVYAQLVAEGLHPLMIVQLTNISAERICLWAEGEEHVLAPIVAANISVIPLPAQQRVHETFETLASLKPGDKATVVRLSPTCRGMERRRLMDLGILPGTIVAAEMTSPTGDPTAFRIRGALIALRAEQTSYIQISDQGKAA